MVAVNRLARTAAAAAILVVSLLSVAGCGVIQAATVLGVMASSSSSGGSKKNQPPVADSVTVAGSGPRAGPTVVEFTVSDAEGGRVDVDLKVEVDGGVLEDVLGAGATQSTHGLRAEPRSRGGSTYDFLWDTGAQFAGRGGNALSVRVAAEVRPAGSTAEPARQFSATFVVENVPPAIVSASFAAREVGIAGAGAGDVVTVSGGIPPYALDIDPGALASVGLALDGGATAIVGTPTRTASPLMFAVRVRDAAGVPTAPVPATLQIEPRLALTTSFVPLAQPGGAYGYFLPTKGGVGAISFEEEAIAPPPGVRFSIGLPTGTALSVDGELVSGAAPVAPGEFLFGVVARDALGAESRGEFILRVRSNSAVARNVPIPILQYDALALGDFAGGEGGDLALVRRGAEGAPVLDVIANDAGAFTRLAPLGVGFEPALALAVDFDGVAPQELVLAAGDRYEIRAASGGTPLAGSQTVVVGGTILALAAADLGGGPGGRDLVIVRDTPEGVSFTVALRGDPAAPFDATDGPTDLESASSAAAFELIDGKGVTVPALAVVDDVAGVVRTFVYDGARFIAGETLPALASSEGNHVFAPRVVVAADLDDDGVRDDIVISGVVGTGVVASLTGGIVIGPGPDPTPDPIPIPGPIAKGGFRRVPHPPPPVTPGAASVFVVRGLPILDASSRAAEDLANRFDIPNAKEFRSPSFTPEPPGAVAVADLHDEGDSVPRADLLIPLPGERSVAVVRGPIADADPDLRRASRFPVQTRPDALLVGQHDADPEALPDVLLARSSGRNVAAVQSFALIRNISRSLSPRFNEMRAVPLPRASADESGDGIVPAALFLGDFNGDGRADVVVQHVDVAGTPEGGSVAQRITQQNFTGDASIDSLGQSVDFIAGPSEEDDIPATDPDATATDVFFGESSGTTGQDFAQAIGSLLLGQPSAALETRLRLGFAAGDVDGDPARTEIVLTTLEAVEVRGLGDGGTFELRGRLPTETAGVPNRIALAELHAGPDAATHGADIIMLSERDGLLAFVQRAREEGDDEALDLFFSLSSGPSLVQVAESDPANLEFAVVDLDGDGSLDAAVAQATTPPRVAVLFGDGAGGLVGPGAGGGGDEAFFFPLGLNAPDTAIAGMAAADIDGDGDEDLVLLVSQLVRNPNFTESKVSFVHVLRNRAADGAPRAGLLEDPLLNIPLVAFHDRAIAAADFTGDGAIDVAVLGSGEAAALTLLRGFADPARRGQFEETSSLLIGRRPSELQVGDLDRDRIPDVAIFGDAFDEVIIISSDGRGVLVKQQL